MRRSHPAFHGRCRRRSAVRHAWAGRIPAPQRAAEVPATGARDGAARVSPGGDGRWLCTNPWSSSVPEPLHEHGCLERRERHLRRGSRSRPPRRHRHAGGVVGRGSRSPSRDQRHHRFGAPLHEVGLDAPYPRPGSGGNAPGLHDRDDAALWADLRGHPGGLLEPGDRVHPLDADHPGSGPRGPCGRTHRGDRPRGGACRVSSAGGGLRSNHGGCQRGPDGAGVALLVSHRRRAGSRHASCAGEI